MEFIRRGFEKEIEETHDCVSGSGGGLNVGRDRLW